MKKKLLPVISLGLASIPLFLLGYINHKEKKEEQKNIANTIIIQYYSDFMKEDPTKNPIYYDVCYQYFENKRYLLDHIQNNPKLNSREILINEISKNIANNKHIYKNRGRKVKDLSELSNPQLQKIYLVYQSLQTPEFCKKLEKIIEEDLNDSFAEHGGIVNFDEYGRLTLKSYPSTLGIKDNRAYQPPLEAVLENQIASFHLHAVKKHYKRGAHPSEIDLLDAFRDIKSYGTSDKFLITPLRNGIVNIDYFGGDSTKSFYPKILDLGTFNLNFKK
jgi:hypothetical protein